MRILTTSLAAAFLLLAAGPGGRAQFQENQATFAESSKPEVIALVLEATQAARAGNPAVARGRAGAALKADPSCRRARLLLAALASPDGEGPESLRLYRELVAEGESFPPGKVPRSVVEASVRLGDLYRDRKDARRALYFYSIPALLGEGSNADAFFPMGGHAWDEMQRLHSLLKAPGYSPMQAALGARAAADREARLNNVAAPPWWTRGLQPNLGLLEIAEDPTPRKTPAPEPLAGRITRLPDVEPPLTLSDGPFLPCPAFSGGVVRFVSTTKPILLRVDAGKAEARVVRLNFTGADRIGMACPHPQGLLVGGPNCGVRLLDGEGRSKAVLWGPVNDGIDLAYCPRLQRAFLTRKDRMLETMDLARPGSSPRQVPAGGHLLLLAPERRLLFAVHDPRVNRHFSLAGGLLPLAAAGHLPSPGLLNTGSALVVYRYDEHGRVIPLSLRAAATPGGGVSVSTTDDGDSLLVAGGGESGGARTYSWHHLVETTGAYPAGPGLTAESVAAHPFGDPVCVGDAEALRFHARGETRDPVVLTGAFGRELAWTADGGALVALRRTPGPGGKLAVAIHRYTLSPREQDLATRARERRERWVAEGEQRRAGLVPSAAAAVEALPARAHLRSFAPSTDLSAAVTAMRGALELPATPPLPAWDGEAGYGRRGDVLVEEVAGLLGQLNGANAAYLLPGADALLKRDKEFPPTHYARGILRSRSGDREGALASLLAAVRGDAGRTLISRQALIEMSRIHARMQQPAQALSALAEAARLQRLEDRLLEEMNPLLRMQGVIRRGEDGSDPSPSRGRP